MFCMSSAGSDLHNYISVTRLYNQGQAFAICPNLFAAERSLLA